MREARRPRGGGVMRAVEGEEGEGRGRRVERGMCGVLAEIWCQVREYASFV